MKPFMQDTKLLLAASHDLLRSDEFGDDRLQAWAVERNVIFDRLREQNITGQNSSEASLLSSLLREILDLDSKICARLVESQIRVGEQIAAARKIHQVLGQRSSRTPQLLQRLA